MKVVVDPKRPAGDRVLSVQVGDAPLDPSRTYSVGANNFMFSGGDDYGRFLTAGRVLVGLTDGSLIANAVMGEVRRVGTVTIATEGRITLL